MTFPTLKLVPLSFWLKLWSADSVGIRSANVPLVLGRQTWFLMVEDAIDGCCIGRCEFSSDVDNNVLADSIVYIEFMHPVNICFAATTSKYLSLAAALLKRLGSPSIEANELLAISAKIWRLKRVSVEKKIKEEEDVGTSYVKSSCSGIIKFYVPPEIHVQTPKTGGRVKRLTLSSLIISKYSLCM
ncbi:hypothetical protein V6N13_030086 [Hibiscus sabdariffa]